VWGEERLLEKRRVDWELKEWVWRGVGGGKGVRVWCETVVGVKVGECC
jgi:hypothetical protein